MTPYYADGLVTLYLGDALEVLPGIEPVDVAFADPPYNVGVDYGVARDDLPPAEYVAWCARWFEMLRAVAGRILVTPGLLNANMAQWLARKPDGLGCWYKPGNAGGAGLFQFCEWEPVFVWGRGRIGGTNVFRATTNISFGPGDHADHPTPKPVRLLTGLLESAGGETVLDPFAGSGSTLVAAKSLGRPSVGIEINERYCETAANRCRQEVLGLVS